MYMASSLQKTRIAIVGAGPGGLVLARILDQKGVRATVFEREAKPASRPQGGSLDMHEDSGQLAIARAGLTDVFQKIARFEDQEFRVYDKSGVLRASDTDSSSGNRPEVDRGQLRQMLLESLPSSTIRWSHSLSAVEPQDDGTVDLLFQHGARENFDLVVGADGTWSRVRPALSDTKPAYSGITMYELGISDADVQHPKLAQVVGRGLMFALGDSKAIGGHRDANAHLGIYAGMRVEENAVRNLTPETRQQLKPMLLAEFSDWAPDLYTLIVDAAETVEPRPIYVLPVGHRWEHRPGVTILGDAAHVMSPFGGDGANLAMRDAADLALAITEEADWQSAVQSFEVEMCRRAEPSAAGANQTIQDVFSERGLEHMLDMFQQIHQEHHAS
jgi:2-polyprenyl-6-methoxyphenol hydroxylase-like FAD-dependent oxidoreductase